MSNQQKYFKYKNKYIELKKKLLIGGERIDREIELIKPLGLYKDIALDAGKKVLKLTRIRDEAKIIVNLPDNYPIGEPIIYINDQKVNINNWTPIKRITEFLEFNKKVLILCHARKVDGSFEPLVLKNHWYEDIFNELFLEYNLKGNPSFETVDSTHGGTFVADAFSDEFIDKHISEYDLIMVPDCGGIWYYLQVDQTRDIKILIEKCIKLTKMLKPNGIIEFSKFLKVNPEFTGEFENTLKHNLEQIGFTVMLKVVNSLTHLVAQKN